VPVSFAEIDTVSVLCEIVAMRENLVPDVSLGTHFFNDLVEWDMLYLALFPGRAGNQWSLEFFEQSANRLEGLIPDAAQWAHAVGSSTCASRVTGRVPDDLGQLAGPEGTLLPEPADQQALPPGRGPTRRVGSGTSAVERTA